MSDPDPFLPAVFSECVGRFQCNVAIQHHGESEHN